MDSQANRILIIHCSAGHGHLKAALALEEAFKGQGPGVQVEVIDALSYLPLGMSKGYARSYLFMIQHACWLWKLVYEISDTLVRWRLFRWIRSQFNRSTCQVLIRKIINEKPSMVITTHFLPAELMAGLKRGGLAIPTVACITDFKVHRFWFFKEIDAYMVAHEASKIHLTQLGAHPSKVHVTGIPISIQFSSDLDRPRLIREHGLNAEKPTILFTSGGAGAVHKENLIVQLLRQCPEVQVLFVSGRNHELYKELEKIAVQFPQVEPFKFVDNMHELMEISDIVVGKAGGLTLSEALAKRRLFIVMDPVPGQEVNNARVLEDAGAVLWIKFKSDLVGTVQRLLENEERRKRMLQSIDEVRRPHAAREIAHWCVKYLNQ